MQCTWVQFFILVNFSFKFLSTVPQLNLPQYSNNPLLEYARQQTVQDNPYAYQPGKSGYNYPQPSPVYPTVYGPPNQGDRNYQPGYQDERARVLNYPQNYQNPQQPQQPQNPYGTGPGNYYPQNRYSTPAPYPNFRPEDERYNYQDNRQYPSGGDYQNPQNNPNLYNSVRDLQQLLSKWDIQGSEQCTNNVAAQWNFETHVSPVTQLAAVSLLSYWVHF